MPTAEQNAIVQAQIEELYAWHHTRGDDRVVGYYPPAMRAEADRFGMAFTHVDGTQWCLGDSDYAFPMQSISKVFIYALALEDNGREATLRRVGVEPSGDPFNSITFDEVNNRPFNPMINAGALVATRLVHGGDTRQRVARIVDKLRLYAGNPRLCVDEDLLAQELASNDRNLAISYLMRSLGMIDGDLYENLTVYLAACSVRVTARDLATMGATLAYGGRNPITGDEALPRPHVRDVVTVMMMCGMYTAAGEWAYDVGIPAKSAVSGGLLVTMPGRFGAAFFSPGLDRHGNSVRGVGICRDLSTRLGLHMYADPAESTFGRQQGPGRRRD
ncbi:MAG: glutaminase A [Streptosporangiales bacterium]|nr:glutaminase A [Streptosporangiales bacterium]MBO0889533.1 glutaminase A [Acidothermales bacterium]